MSESGLKEIVVIITIILMAIIGGKYVYVYPRIIEGRVVLFEHSVFMFDNTMITFTTFGGEEHITLGGPWDLKVGAIYRIEYYTPFWYAYAIPLSITCTG